MLDASALLRTRHTLRERLADFDSAEMDADDLSTL